MKPYKLSSVKANQPHNQSSRAVWRLIPLLRLPGKTQMAIDRWLLARHQQGQVPPTLRFYTWSPAAISLGYHQRRVPQHWKDLADAGVVDLVRRPTGGRAVLHGQDLTYAVVTSGIEGKRLQVYEAICEFLIVGWRSLGVELHYGSAGRGYFHNPNCFTTATGADLVTAQGEKLIGSAQVKRGDTVLQHGAMRLGVDEGLFTQVFAEPAPTINLPLDLQGDALVSAAIEALVQAAKQCFEVEFGVEPLSESEWQEILDGD